MDNWTGFLRLGVQRKQEKTIPADVYNQGAYKISPPVYLDKSGLPCFYLMNPGGGYVDGDTYKAEIRLGEQAQMMLTTQSSTKIYKTIKQPVIQETEIAMEAGSYLEYIGDPIIAYRHARYVQKTVVRMKRCSSIIYGDIITPGWSPDGSLFRYDRLQLKTMVYLEDELVAYDHLQLSPNEKRIDGLGLLEGYTHMGSMLVIGEWATPDFVERISEALGAVKGPAQFALSALAISGFALRVRASSTQHIEAVFEDCRRFVRKHGIGKQTASLRKY